MKKYWFYLAYIYLINLFVKVWYKYIFSFRNVLLTNLSTTIFAMLWKQVNQFDWFLHGSKNGINWFFLISTENRYLLAISRSCSQSEYGETLWSGSIYSVTVNDNLFKANVSVLQKPVTSKSTCSANKLTDFCLTQKQPFADVFQNRSSRTAFFIEHFWWLLLLIGIFVLIELTHFNLMFHFYTPINLSSMMTWQRVIRV